MEFRVSRVLEWLRPLIANKTMEDFFAQQA
jgi:hypothetical protein